MGGRPPLAMRAWRWLRLAAAVVCLFAGLNGCGSGLGSGPSLVLVPELYESDRYPAENIDSLAVWESGRQILCTAKSTDRLLVFETSAGRLVRAFGETGSALGQFRRPNGVAMVGDYALVVERDNRRVQVLLLPDLVPLGSFGEDDLRNPYGLAAFVMADGDIEVYVTDSYLDEDGEVPPGTELGERVKHYRVRVASGTVSADLVRRFGETSGSGVLHLVESIAVDSDRGRLLIADEHADARDIKVYDLAGNYTGVVLGRGHYLHEPEGIALMSCGAGGWWITTDQRQQRTVFHLYARDSLNYAGAFVGRRVANTDGIAVHGIDSLSGDAGVLFAVDDDQAVAAFEWSAIARSLGLPSDCPSGAWRGTAAPTE